jgi:fluoride exporter
MLSIAAISLGAALGASLRWLLGVQLDALFPALPPGTLTVNLIGGYLVGVAVTVWARRPGLSQAWRLFTVTGFLGGLTTFSAFSAEVATQWLAGQTVWAMTAVVLHVLGSLAMTLLGIGTVALLRARRHSGRS